MSGSNWTDAIVGERMAVDQQFSSDVRESSFSNQEWGLIMTAAEFEIADADDPEAARIVPDTSKVAAIMPEVEKMDQRMGGMGGGGGGSKNKSGITSTVKNALGLGGSKDDDGADPERVAAAEELLEAYAAALQEHLAEKGRWEQVRIAYQE
ncbi:DUF5799 family protein [Halolamina sp.]|jgi:hypothetical protein|uniref:DUF5799 family protein n=1 Tax=Halolamina sp. TaxID=1940283 RepID=UPI000223B54D|nr:hypothetical protein Halar_1689 [halophilic archaeon DL31]